MFPDLHELSSGELFQLERIGITKLPHKIGGVQMSRAASAATAAFLLVFGNLRHLAFEKVKDRGLLENRK